MVLRLLHLGTFGFVLFASAFLTGKLLSGYYDHLDVLLVILYHLCALQMWLGELRWLWDRQPSAPKK